jgi:hypothetical protein
MLKFGLCAGIAFEWIHGAPVVSLQSLASASIRALMATMLAWAVLEALQAVWRVVMMLDDQPPGRGDAKPAR